MFRREMGSKRESLPPKKGDLTSMDNVCIVKDGRILPPLPYPPPPLHIS